MEAFDSAVRWDRKGLYRSRWGNYDLALTDGLFTLSEGLLGADLLASRLQGQDVQRSGFYDVVRNPVWVGRRRRKWPSRAILQADSGLSAPGWVRIDSPFPAGTSTEDVAREDPVASRRAVTYTDQQVIRPGRVWLVARSHG